MARRPRPGPRDQASTQSVEITDKEILRYDSHNRRLKMRIQLDGVDYKKTARNVQIADEGLHLEILNKVAEHLRLSKERGDTARDMDDLKEGVGDWAGRPEGEDKQRVAQYAMREVVRLAREGKVLQVSGRTRPQAFEAYAQTRSLKTKIWDNLSGTHAEKAVYLALEGPGNNTEYGELNQYMNDLEAAAPDWNAVVDFMDTCANPKQVDTEVTV